MGSALFLGSVEGCTSTPSPMAVSASIEEENEELRSRLAVAEKTAAEAVRRTGILAQEAMEQKNIAAKTQAEMIEFRTEQGARGAAAAPEQQPTPQAWLPEGRSIRHMPLRAPRTFTMKPFLQESNLDSRTEDLDHFEVPEVSISSLSQVQTLGPRHPTVGEFHAPDFAEVACAEGISADGKDGKLWVLLQTLQLQRRL